MMKRRWVSFLLVLCLVVACLPVQVFAYTVGSGSFQNKDGQKFYWNISNTGVLTISGTGTMGSYQTIFGKNDAPWQEYEHDIKKVIINNGPTDIADGAFFGCTELKEISIPSSVKCIGSYAFLDCYSLENVTLPKKLETIESGAFSNTALTSIVIPESVHTMGSGVFQDCSGLLSATFNGAVTDLAPYTFASCHKLQDVYFTAGLSGKIGERAFSHCAFTSFDIPASVTMIRERAFEGCSNLSSVTLPEGLQSIWNSAFYDTALVSVTIPQTVGFVDTYVFGSCDNLKNITMHTPAVERIHQTIGNTDALEYVHIIGDAPKNDQNIFWSKNEDFVVYYDEGTSGWNPPYWGKYIIVPWGKENVTYGGSCGDQTTWSLVGATLTISGSGEMEYYDPYPWHLLAYRIKHIVVKEGVTHIANGAFDGTENLVSVTIEKGVKVIGALAFADCPALTEVNLSEGLETIAWGAFDSCTALTSIELPKGLKTLNNSAFCNCTELVSVNMPDSVTTLQSSIFSGCVKLKNVKLSAQLTELPSAIFRDCTSLESVVLPENLVKIGDTAFMGCTELTSVNMPDSVTTIQFSIFNGCVKLKNVKLSAQLTEIPPYAFAECSSLESVVLPEGITKIGNNAFDNCAALTAIDLPEGVTEIDYSAFKGTAIKQITIPASMKLMKNDIFLRCQALKTVYFEGDAPQIEDVVFSGVTCVCIYPAGNETWTEDVRKNYGGNLTWLSSDHTHIYPETGTIVPPTCVEKGYTTYQCICGYAYRDTYVDATGVHSFTDAYDPACDVCGFTRQITKLPVYRLYNPYTYEHLLTSGAEEKDLLLSIGWTLDGIAWEAPVEGGSVYRLYNPYDDWHTYTTSEAEKDTMVAAGWTVDGVVSRSATQEDGKPIYRLFNPYVQTNYHLFSAGEEEIKLLVNAGWILEGIAWYAVK